MASGMPCVVYNGPVNLLSELVDLLRDSGLDAGWTPPAPRAGCDTITARIPTNDVGKTFTAVAEWNGRYPPFGAHVEP
jgi:hypothetical protein